MKKLFKNTNGITLIALVITIIVLLILAGITINQLTGSGLFENSKLAEKKYENAQAIEDDTLLSYENEIKNYINNSRDTDISNDLNVTISEISSISMKVTIANEYDDAVYIYIANNQILKHSNENEVVLDNLQFATNYNFTVFAIEGNEKIHKGSAKAKTREGVWLYKDGTSYDLAGGFSIQGYVNSSNNTLTPYDDYMRLNVPADSTAALIRETNIINFAEYKKVYVRYYNYNNGSYFHHRMFISTADNYNGVEDEEGNLNIYYNNTDSTSNNYLVELDVSELTSNAYLYIRKTHKGYLDIQQIWLEK